MGRQDGFPRLCIRCPVLLHFMSTSNVSGLYNTLPLGTMLMLRRALGLVALLWVVGCAHTARQTWKVEDPAIMKATLRERIPMGSSISEARRYMESEGFECRDVLNGKFIERTWFGDEQPAYDGLDYIRCTRSQSAGFLMGRIWTVAVVHDGSIVTDVLVSHYVDGP